MSNKATLVLSDGKKFDGFGYGYMSNTASSDIFINMLEHDLESVVTKASNAGQICICNFNIFGASGVSNDFSANLSHNVAGVVLGSMQDCMVEGRLSLNDFLSARGIPCVAGIDINKLKAHLNKSKDKLTAKIVYEKPTLLQVARPLIGTLVNYKIGDSEPTIAVVDTGMDETDKQLLLKKASINMFGDFDYNQIVASNPRLIVLSDGKPSNINQKLLINIIKANLYSKNPIPMLGIGQGYLALASAYGIKINNLPYGTFENKIIRNITTNQTYTIKCNISQNLIIKSTVPDIKIDYQFVDNNMPAGMYYRKSKSRGLVSGGELLKQWLDSSECNI